MPQYKIIRNVDPEKLEKEIVNLLCDGWLLSGGVFVLTIINNSSPDEFYERYLPIFEYEYIQAVYRL